MRVLIIDDSRDVSHLTTVLVERFGHEAKAVTVPQAAVDIAKDWQPEFVFMDLAMPGMDGYEVARRLRQEVGLNATKIIAISGYNLDNDKAQAAGITGHVQKPISVVKIKRVFDESLAET